MSDDGWEAEQQILDTLNNPWYKRFGAGAPLIREKRGLPPHYKCSCKTCAKWRAANWQKIESLDWRLVQPNPTNPQTQAYVDTTIGSTNHAVNIFPPRWA